jgi:signal transduction histidine kinase
MRISFRKKIISVLAVYMLVGGSVWFLNYYNSALINHNLQILENKEDVLNTVLEARRFEKNFFLTLHVQHLDSAIDYIRQAEEKMVDPDMVYTGVLTDRGATLQQHDLVNYRQAMEGLLDSTVSGRGASSERLSTEAISSHQETIRQLGHLITEDSETMVRIGRKHISRLVIKSQFYHFTTLGGMILITVLAVLFFFFNVLRPLKTLEGAIDEIALGNYDNIPSIAPAVEFESLVGSLNKMISMLNQRSEDLIQAKKLAALGTLTSGVAHEVNNPLNNIFTSVQILLEELEDSDLDYKRELLTNAEKEVERARDIVRALLEFSRQRTFSIQTEMVKPLVDDTLMLIMGELPATIQLKVDVPDGIQAAVDRRRIQQVLLNLIFNAIQAMEKGGTLTISARPIDANTFYLRVVDTGKGIPPELLRKIFDPFFSTKTARRRSEENTNTFEGFVEHEGTGLGLAICHGIVKKHGGRFDVQSKPGEGSSFTVYLPMRKSDAIIR